jgi:CMP-N-acetylneuraminic acid synthetase
VLPDGALVPICGIQGLTTRSQDLAPAFVISGCLYVSGVEDFRTRRSFLGDDTRALVIEDRRESVDIDDAWDWTLAECLALRARDETDRSNVRNPTVGDSA